MLEERKVQGSLEWTSIPFKGLLCAMKNGTKVAGCYSI